MEILFRRYICITYTEDGEHIEPLPRISPANLPTPIVRGSGDVNRLPGGLDPVRGAPDIIS
jgi:hypothetical protein